MRSGTCIFRRRVLLKPNPPVSVSKGVLKRWFVLYMNAKVILSSRHLELECGGRIRGDGDACFMDPPRLREWLMKHCSVGASEVICQTWRTRDWSTSGQLKSVSSIQSCLGNRLLLRQNKATFFQKTVHDLMVALCEG